MEVDAMGVADVLGMCSRAKGLGRLRKAKEGLPTEGPGRSHQENQWLPPLGLSNIFLSTFLIMLYRTG